MPQMWVLTRINDRPPEHFGRDEISSPANIRPDLAPRCFGRDEIRAPYQYPSGVYALKPPHICGPLYKCYKYLSVRRAKGPAI